VLLTDRCSSQCHDAIFLQENFREMINRDAERARETSALTSGLYLGREFSVARGYRVPTARAPYLLHNRADGRAETSGI